MKNIFLILLLVLYFSACTDPKIERQQYVDPWPVFTPTNIDNVDSTIVDRSHLLKPLFLSIDAQKKEMLPFDEPKTEFGQQDGSLRNKWYWAYMTKKHVYRLNGDKYRTFHAGRPWPPQVCADFIIDTLDRAAGTWYSADKKRPGRIKGKIDFRKDIIDVGLSPRRTSDIVEFFKQNPEDFEFIFSGEGPPVGDVKYLKNWLSDAGAQLGDIILISGEVPWDPREHHNHSFFLTGLDEKGLPDKVTGNPVYPVERSILVEGKRTPKRQVMYIIRISNHLLQRL